MSGIEFDIKAFFSDAERVQSIASEFNKFKNDLRTSYARLMEDVLPKALAEEFDYWRFNYCYGFQKCLVLSLYGKGVEPPVCKSLEALGAELISVRAYHDGVGERYRYGWKNGKRITQKAADRELNKLDPFLAFQHAIEKGQVKKLREFIAEGMEVNAALNGVLTPLMHASFKGHSSVIEALIEAGAEVDATIDGNRSALLYAALGLDVYEDDASALKPLLEGGADPNRLADSPLKASYGVFQDVEQLTPLMLAANKSPAATELLIRHGADPNLENNAGMTPLMFAMNGADAKSVANLRMLVQAGADIHATDASGRNCLDYTDTSTSQDTALRALGATYSIPEYSGDSNADLYTAINYDDCDKVQELAAVIDINQPISRGERKVWPIKLALDLRRSEIVELLVNEAVDLSSIDASFIATDNRKRSLVLVACEAGCLSNLKLLLEKGLDAHCVDSNGESALDHVFKIRLPDEYVDKQAIVELLLELGVPFGNSLAAAINSGSAEILELFEQTNAFEHVDDPKNVMNQLIWSQDLDLLLKYRQWMQDNGFTLAGISLYGEQEELEFNVKAGIAFIENGIDVNHSFSSAGISCALHLVLDELARSGSITAKKSILLIEYLDALLAAGADPGTDPRQCASLIMYLLKVKGRESVIAKLIDHGADINQTIHTEGNWHADLLVKPRLMEGEYSALMLAAANGKLDYVRFLCERGADPAIANNYDGDALKLAETNGHEQVAQFLRNL